MIPYIIIFLLFLLGLAFDKEKPIFQNAYYIFLIAVAILFAGIRDMIGGYDIYIYSEVYEATWEEIVLHSPFEQGFKYYFLALKYINDKREFMIFMTSFLMLTLHAITIKRHSSYMFFSLLIYFCKFYLMSFVYFRQGLAMGILWLSIPFIVNRKFLPFLLTSILAFYFHKSSIVFFPLYFIANMNFSKKAYIWIPIATLIFAISPLSNMLISLVGEELDSKYAHYTNKASTFNVFYLIESSVLAYLLVKFRDDLQRHKFGKFLNNALFVYILLSFMAITNATYIRFIWYYMFFLVIAIPVFYGFIKSSQNRMLFKTAIVTYFVALFFRLLILWDGGDMMPYKSIFSDEPRNGMWDFMEYRHRKLIE